MKNYKEALKHIKVNKHRIQSKTYGGIDQDMLNLVLDTIAYVYDKQSIDVTNDYADVK